MVECQRCGACCTVIPIFIADKSPEYIKYLRTRGLEEDQGFFLIPHVCQYLRKSPDRHERMLLGWNGKYECIIHDSPDRPYVCRKFEGQKRIGRTRIYVPPGCAFRKR